MLGQGEHRGTCFPHLVVAGRQVRAGQRSRVRVQGVLPGGTRELPPRRCAGETTSSAVQMLQEPQSDVCAVQMNPVACWGARDLSGAAGHYQGNV